MLICKDCKLKREERVGVWRRRVQRCGIHERYVGLNDRCTATPEELTAVAAALNAEAREKMVEGRAG